MTRVEPTRTGSGFTPHVAVAFAVPLALYAATAATTLQGGDTGEFARVALEGGVVHPPGYPLYTMLSRVVAMVPLGEPFHRLSLFSGLLGAAAIAVLQRALARISGSERAALAASLVFAVSPIAWRVAGVPEVFSLAALMLAGTLLACVRLAQSAPSARPARAAVLGLVFGLGLANHHTIVLLAPLCVWAFWAARGPGALRLCGWGMGGLALGLLPYLYLPLAAAGSDAGHWVWGEPSTTRGFFRHLLRTEYGSFRLGIEGASSAPQFWVWRGLAALPRQWAVLWFGVGLAGFVAAWRRERTFASAVGGSLVLTGIVFPALFNLAESDLAHAVVERFQLFPSMLFAIPVAIGASALEGHVRPSMARAIVSGTIVLAAIWSWPSANWRDEHYVERYLSASVRDLERGSVVLGQGDLATFGIPWVTTVLEIRPDVKYVDVNLLRHRWYYERIRKEIPDLDFPYDPARTRLPALVRSLVGSRPTYATMRVARLSGGPGLQIWPEGFLARLSTGENERPPLSSLEETLERATRALPLDRPPRDAWAASIRDDAAVPWKVLGDEWSRQGDVARAAAAHERMRFLLSGRATEP